MKCESRSAEDSALPLLASGTDSGWGSLSQSSAARITDKTFEASLPNRSIGDKEAMGLVDLLPVGVGQVELATGRWISFNRWILDLTGCARRELLGLRITDFFNPTDGALFRSFMRNIAKRPEGEHHRLARWIRRDGGERIVKLRMVLADTAAIMPSTAMVILEDVSALQNAEQRLQEAEKLQAVGRLAASVAHDFNNVFMAVQMQLELMVSQPGMAATVQSELRELETEISRAARLNRQLLNHSRPLAMRKEPLNLSQAVEGISNMLRRLLGSRAELQVFASPKLPLVSADAGMIDQVIMNLVLNARDAQLDGGRITVHLATKYFRTGGDTHPKTGNYVCLTVADEGCGMDQATLSRIFEPFFTTKGPGRGTGIGLSTVQNIVSNHNGWIEVDSRVGMGTQFHVYFPAVIQ